MTKRSKELIPEIGETYRITTHLTRQRGVVAVAAAVVGVGVRGGWVGVGVRSRSCGALAVGVRSRSRRAVFFNRFI